MMQVLGPLGLLETKFRRFDGELALKEGAEISGYASLFDASDQGGDVVQRGAYGGSLAKLAAAGRGVKMLWQHDPTQPIGVWDEVREDERGLFVKGRLLLEVRTAREQHHVGALSRQARTDVSTDGSRAGDDNLHRKATPSARTLARRRDAGSCRSRCAESFR